MGGAIRRAALVARRTPLLAGTMGDGESNAAILFCNDYLRLGPRRSVSEVWRRYNAQPNIAPVNLNTIQGYSSLFKWPERARDYDTAIDQAKTVQVQEEMDEAYGSGISLVHERLRRLKEIEDYLMAQFREVDVDGNRKNVWLEENRQMAGELVVNRKFNNHLVQMLLDIYEDAALETGGRRLKVDTTNLNVQITAEDLAVAQAEVKDLLFERFGPASLPPGLTGE